MQLLGPLTMAGVESAAAGVGRSSAVGETFLRLHFDFCMIFIIRAIIMLTRWRSRGGPIRQPKAKEKPCVLKGEREGLRYPDALKSLG